MATAAAVKNDDFDEDAGAGDARAALAGDDFEVVIDEATSGDAAADEAGAEGDEGDAGDAAGDEGEGAGDAAGDEGEGAGDAAGDEGDETTAGEGDDDEFGEPADDEFKSLSSKVQKRVMRERRLARRERAEKEKLIAERQQIIPAVKKLVAEKFSLEDENFSLREGYVTLLTTGLEREIGTTLQLLTAAKADGKDDDEIKYLSSLQELNARKLQAQDLATQLNTAKAARPSKEDRDKQAAAAAASTTQTAATQPAVNPLTKKWLAVNKNWFGKPQFAAESGAAAAIDRQLAADGYDPGTQAYFTEWDRRIDHKFPTLRKKGKSVVKPNTSHKTPVAAATPAAASGNGSAGVNKNKVTLTKADLDIMRGLKLDISNPEVLREFARQKMKG